VNIRRARRGGAGTGERHDPARATTPQRDEALGTAPQRQHDGEAQYDEMKLPHERDESSAGEPDAVGDRNGTRAVTRQGAKDVESGKQDTDCYNANAPRYDKREGKT
jgi:hypothetical protein